jgi:optic atrophy 3 protein
MAHIPAAKLFSLFVKTLAKPVAKELKSKAATHQSLRTAVIWLGQSAHKVTTIVQIRSAGFKASNIKPLEERQAMLT